VVSDHRDRLVNRSGFIGTNDWQQGKGEQHATRLRPRMTLLAIQYDERLIECLLEGRLVCAFESSSRPVPFFALIGTALVIVFGNPYAAIADEIRVTGGVFLGTVIDVPLAPLGSMIYRLQGPDFRWPKAWFL
jgi:hypothetical protein